MGQPVTGSKTGTTRISISASSLEMLIGSLGVERLLTAVEHEEGEGEVLLTRELEAAHKVDGPLAQVRPGLLDERPHRAAAEGQLGEARVGMRHVVEQRQARVEVVDERSVVVGGKRAKLLLRGGGRSEDGVLEADALGAAEFEHLPVHVRQVAARERVEEAQARDRRVGRVAQRAVLGEHTEDLLQAHAVDHLGELGERREDARGRPPHVVGDEAVRLQELNVRLGAAEREVLHRAHATAHRIEVVAEAEAAAREPRLHGTVEGEAHCHGDNGRGGGRVAAEEELALARRVDCAVAARTQFAHKGLETERVYYSRVAVSSSGSAGHGHHGHHRCN
jgi:hypothetical protein